jgi:periplasmic protein TonB
MSYANKPNRANPAGIAAAIVVNGAIASALMFMTVTQGTRTVRPSTKTFDVENKTPPPEQKVEPKPAEDQLQTVPPVFVPDPLVQLNKPDKDQITTTITPPVNPSFPIGGTLGEETKIAAVDIDKIVKPEILPPAPIFKSAVRDPRFAGMFQPNYPVAMLQREIEGTVTIRVLIGTDGRVRQANVIKAATPEFAAATEKQALTKWRFKPATRGGEQVEDWQTLTVRFDIN